jgi:preprotein translocase subunit YajC
MELMDIPGTAMVLLAQPAPDPKPEDPSGGLTSLVFPIMLAFLFVYFFMIRPQKRDQEAKQNLLGALRKNDRVVTTGGMFGTIVNIKDDEVTLRVDDQAKVKIRFQKSAIARVADTSSSKEEESKKS